MSRQTPNPKSPAPRFCVVLVEPEIPFNTGNVGRTCLGVESDLHLVGRLGFSLEDRYLKRAGLDYWPRVAVSVHPDARAYFRDFDGGNAFFFSARARRSFWDQRVPAGARFVFGRETKGLPPFLRRRYASRFFRLPFPGPIRSFNLSTAVGMVLGEACRQQVTLHHAT